MIHHLNILIILNTLCKKIFFTNYERIKNVYLIRILYYFYIVYYKHK